MNIKTILITGARSFAALDLARMFFNLSIKVITADCIKTSVCQLSKTVSMHYQTASPQYHFERFVNDLQHIVLKEKIDLIIPTCEEIFYLSQASNKISAPIFCPPFELLKQLHNKWEFYNLLLKMGFKTPKTYLLSQNCPENGKWILKPVYSRFAAKVKVVNGSITSYPLDSINPWIAQEFIEGEKLCSYTVCHEGKVAAHGVYTILHSMGIGSSICFKSVQNDQIDDFVRRFVSQTKFTGQIAFDFIQNDTLYCIECNPRATSGIHLFKRSEKLAKSFFTCKEPLRPIENQIFHDYLFMLWFGIKQKEIFTKSFWHHFLSGKSPLWCNGDNALILKLPVILLNTAKVTLLKKQTFSQAMTEGIEYNG